MFRIVVSLQRQDKMAQAPTFIDVISLYSWLLHIMPDEACNFEVGKNKSPKSIYFVNWCPSVEPLVKTMYKAWKIPPPLNIDYLLYEQTLPELYFKFYTKFSVWKSYWMSYFSSVT